ncbi:MAG: ABC transporter ATP-binding protein [Rickettsiaceae bacterium]
MNNNIKTLIKYLSNHTGQLVVVFLSLFSVAFAILSIGYVFKNLIDSGLRVGEISMINHSIYLICGLIGIFAVGSFCRSYFINIIALKITAQIKSDTYSNLMNLDVKFFEETKIGDIIARLGNDVEMIGSLIINFLSFFIRNFIMFIGAVTLMFLYSSKLSIIVLVTIPILLLPLLKLSKRVRQLSRQVLNRQGQFAASIEENFTGIRTVHAYNQQIYQAAKFNQQIKQYVEQASRRFKLRSLFFALAISMIAGTITLVIWIGSIDILKGRTTAGEMISFIYYAIMVGMSAGGIAELFSELQGPLAALDRVIELRDIKTPAQATQHYERLNLRGDIIYDKVSFAYPARLDNIVLNNISLTIKSGKITGIVGKSGSGKSTLFQLLLKFYHYQSGNIFIDSQDISLLPADLVRSKIAYVEQDPTIFSGSIRSNIAFAKPESSNDAIEKIAQICGITNFANDLARGLDTDIGERGIRMSGGQRQRIAIARALIYNPEILLLDEATSALDNNSENELLNNIKHYLQGKTIISIAHRISAIEQADEIFVVNQGNIVGHGTHSQLLKDCTIYSALYKEQL